MAVPTFSLEVAFGSRPGDASYTWSNISSRGRAASYSRGRQFELDRSQAGTGAIVVRDNDRAFDSTYASSPYYPNVVPMVPIRGTATIGGTTYFQFQHYVKSWRRDRVGPIWAWRNITTVDGFELLQKPLSAKSATFTTTLGGNRDITYTALDPGFSGNRYSVRYLAGKPFRVGVSGQYALIVYTGDTGVTANQIITGIQNHTEAFRRFNVALAPGSNGTGTVTTMNTVKLAGGAPLRFEAGLSGAHVTSALNAIGWPSALRVTGTGKSTVRAITFQPGDSMAALDYIQAVAGAGGEEGFFFVDGRGRAVFIDRWAMVSPPYTVSQVTFTDQVGGGISYTDAAPDYSDALIVNEWVGTRRGGHTNTVMDLPSQQKYLRRPKEITSTLDDNDQLVPILQMRLARYKDPLDRIASIKVMPGDSTSAWQACLAREPGDRVTVKQNPPGGGTDSREYFVQSIQADIDYAEPVGSAFTFQLWPTDVGNWLIFDDSVYGRMDFNRVAA